MNKETKLLAVLNDVFGMENKIKSLFRTVSQDFDERTNEHIFLIEYRFRGKGLRSSPESKVQKLDLIRQINDRVK